MYKQETSVTSQAINRAMPQSIVGLGFGLDLAARCLGLGLVLSSKALVLALS